MYNLTTMTKCYTDVKEVKLHCKFWTLNDIYI